MSEIHELMMTIEARIEALEKEKARLQDHLEVLSQAEQIRLEYGEKPNTVEPDQSEAREYDEKPRPVERTRYEAGEYEGTLETTETVEVDRSETDEDKYAEKPKTAEKVAPEANETEENIFDLLRKRRSGDER
jgi:hypothetical protein